MQFELFRPYLLQKWYFQILEREEDRNFAVIATLQHLDEPVKLSDSCSVNKNGILISSDTEWKTNLYVLGVCNILKANLDSFRH